MSEQHDKSRLGVHFFYVTLILLALIILLATAKWTELPKFTDYLSTAATITSLVLGLLAIIYAYISNDSLSQTTGVLGGAAQEAQNATSKIVQLVNNVEELTRGTNKTNENLAISLDQLKTQLISLDGTAATLDKQANAIAAVLPEIPKGLEKLEKRFEEFAQAPPNTNDVQKQELPRRELETLAKLAIESSSPAGILLMYACYLSWKTGKIFDVKSFTSFSSGEYFFGFFIAINAVGIIEYEKQRDKKTEYVISDCPEVLSECRQAFEKKILNLKTEESKNRWQKALNDVVDYFES